MRGSAAVVNRATVNSVHMSVAGGYPSSTLSGIGIELGCLNG